MRDLSQPLCSGGWTLPGDPPTTVTDHATMAADGYRVAELGCGTHAGTHVDAPAHVLSDGDTIDAYPPERFVFAVRVVDCTGLAPRAAIGPDALPADDAGEMVLLRTGWDRHWGGDRYREHPYLSPATARRCAEAGWAVGIDAPSPDPTPTERAGPDEPEGLPAHHALLGADRLIVENLTNLAGLDRPTVCAFPLAIAGGDAAPVRAVARE